MCRRLNRQVRAGRHGKGTPQGLCSVRQKTYGSSISPPGPLSNLNKGHATQYAEPGLPTHKEGSDFHTALTTLRGQFRQVRGSSPFPCADLHVCPNGQLANPRKIIEGYMSPPWFGLLIFPVGIFLSVGLLVELRESSRSSISCRILAVLFSPLLLSILLSLTPFSIWKACSFVQDAFLYLSFCLCTCCWHCFGWQKSSACWQEGS
jgi:hypothetical protein